jgi:hypothetical protein
MVTKLVLTGGPCAGKTTCLQAIGQAFADRVLVVPEASTLFLSGGVPPPGSPRIRCSGEEWPIHYQAAILALQRHLEEQFAELAGHCGADLLICDRGLLDGAAYWPGGRDAFLAHFGMDLQDGFMPYATVLHLESLAASDPLRYGTAGNAIRFEQLEEACERERAVQAAWNGHPGWVFVSGNEIEAKIVRVLEVVRLHLS